MTKSQRTERCMSYKKLFIPPLILFFMYLSWIHPVTRSYWNRMDSNAFNYFNSWVQFSSFWQNFWAFVGHRTMDWIHDVVMLLFFFFNIKCSPKALKMQKIAELIFSALLIMGTIQIINGFIFPEWVDLHRDSPTLMNKGAFRLGSVIDWIQVKDHSKKSFPGDHATTAILFASLVFHLMGKKAGLLASLYAVFFCLPRLVSGAHWLTDVLIGSASIAMIATSLAFGTPFANRSIVRIEKGLTVFTRKPILIKS